MSVLNYIRRTAAEWTTFNPQLSRDVMGVESDTGKAKLGDGRTPWASLSYFIGGIGATSFDDLEDAPVLVPRGVLTANLAGELDCEVMVFQRKGVKWYDDQNTEFSTVPVDTTAAPYNGNAIVGHSIAVAEGDTAADCGIWVIASIDGGGAATLERREDSLVGATFVGGEIIYCQGKFCVVLPSGGELEAVLGTTPFEILDLAAELAPQLIAETFVNVVGTPSEGDVVKWVGGSAVWTAP